ncbi:hypothetical protein AYY16_11540 [Morganella psychrotolerans]|nr:hypothetical protein AYY16_11540 [Morganella psychrotolerans]
MYNGVNADMQHRAVLSILVLFILKLISCYFFYRVSSQDNNNQAGNTKANRPAHKDIGSYFMHMMKQILS